MKKHYFILACAMSIAAIGFILYAMGHPELSFPLDSRITSIIYGGYADVVILLFILAFCKKVTRLNILTIIFVLCAVFFLVQSLIGMFPDGHTNWFLPLTLGFNCIAMILNVVQLRKNSAKNYKTDKTYK